MEKLRKIRIGIDVGGTFTDAVAIDSADHSIISSIKIPTTHSAKEGVAKGVVDSLLRIMEEGKIAPEEISFIAHGTTQATNALLEGDVAPVGIIGMGAGVEGVKAKSDTVLGEIPVSAGKAIHTESVFLDTSKGVDAGEAASLLTRLLNAGSRVIVASEAFSVDNPDNELAIQKLCEEKGIESTGGHEISKLYGLKARTRTAAINASILPKMVSTAEMTKQSVIDAKISTPLMIMRCDGGVMKVDEMKKRPILTILSGPAAGVAGALMYERVSDGIFLEVGGTSTDISAVKNGKVMVSYAEIGGHKTYVTSLDVRTVGIGGGSMVRVGKDRITDVGPRSAHIANCGYCVYASPDVLRGGTVELIRPLPEDQPEYVVIRGTDGKKYAITMSCAANYLGYVKEGDYAYGNQEAARAGFEKLGEFLNMDPKKAAEDILSLASAKNEQVVRSLMKDYDLDPSILTLTGGGGGASTVIYALAEHMKVKCQLAKNAPVISTIGAALAMVRDVVERTIINPTEEDLLRIRSEAENRAIESGANPETIEVDVEIDAALNRVRAIAMGTTELVRKDLDQQDLSPEELAQTAAAALSCDASDVSETAHNRFFHIYTSKPKKRGFFSFLKGSSEPACVIDNKGIIKLNLKNAKVRNAAAGELLSSAYDIIREYAVYDESGERAPDVFLLAGSKLIDLKGIGEVRQLAALTEVEAKALASDETVILIVRPKN